MFVVFALSGCGGPSDTDAAFECIDAGAVKIPEAEVTQYDDQAWKFVLPNGPRVCAAEYVDGEWLVTVP